MYVHNIVSILLCVAIKGTLHFFTTPNNSCKVIRFPNIVLCIISQHLSNIHYLIVNFSNIVKQKNSNMIHANQTYD